MKFKEKVGFICRNEAEWIECQKMLFKEGFYWLTDDHNKKLKDWSFYSKNNESYNNTLIIFTDFTAVLYWGFLVKTDVVIYKI